MPSQQFEDVVLIFPYLDGNGLGFVVGLKGGDDRHDGTATAVCQTVDLDLPQSEIDGREVRASDLPLPVHGRGLTHRVRPQGEISIQLIEERATTTRQAGSLCQGSSLGALASGTAGLFWQAVSARRLLAYAPIGTLRLSSSPGK